MQSRRGGLLVRGEKENELPQVKCLKGHCSANILFNCFQLTSLSVLELCGKWAWVKNSPEKGMATHSSTLAWKILWTEGPGRLQSMGSLGVGHDWVTSLSLFTFMHWRRKWQPTPVFLPGESQGRESPVGCCLWGCTESDTTEAT